MNYLFLVCVHKRIIGECLTKKYSTTVYKAVMMATLIYGKSVKCSACNIKSV